MAIAPVVLRPTAPRTKEERRRSGPLLVLLGTTAFVVAVHLVGRWLTRDGTDLRLLGGYVLRAAPDLLISPRVLMPLAVGVAGVFWGPALAARLSWGRLLVGSAAASAVWAVALALTSGWDRLTVPLSSIYEYPHDVPRVGSLTTFLATYLESVPPDSPDPWTAHVGGHPPGALLTFVLLERVGLSGLGWAAALCIAGGALAVPAVLVGVRALADEITARVVAPFAVLAPTALWVATSADGFFTGVTAWGVALLAVAGSRQAGRGRALCALSGGLLLGVGLFLSFGLSALAPLAAAVVVVQHRRIGWGGVVRVLALGAAGTLAVVAVFAACGYWWFDGLAATDARLATGQALTNRPWGYFVVANLAAGALALGPAAVAGLGALRRVRLAVLPLAALAGVLISDLTGVVRGETERIWLPFEVWILAAVAFLPIRQRRIWLAASVAAAIAIEVTLRLEW
jgi:methylthioxylose transferase